MNHLKFLFLTCLGLSFSVYAQSDQIVKHSGEVINGKVLKLNKFTITFTYEGEDAENIVSKYAVENIVYGKSKRVEAVTDKIELNGER